MEYITRVAMADEENVAQFARMIGPKAEQAYMTAAQQIEQRGREEGREKGRTEGQATIVLHLLERRFGPLPTDAIERVQHAQPNELERFADRVLTASSLEEVLEGN
jgi:predicted transposase YdaD